MAQVVSGEASESEEEYENEKIVKAAVYGTEVTGEATESDEDLYENCRGNETLSNASIHMNILQGKLVDANISLWNSISHLRKKFVGTTSQKLMGTDMMLIKSQVSIQSVIASLKEARMNLCQIHGKFDGFLTTHFIPIISNEAK